jgi:uncharacterized protein (DUF58 family)
MKPHIRLILTLFGLLVFASLTFLTDITLAVLSVFLGVTLNMILFKFLKPFNRFSVKREIDKTQVIPPAELKTTLKIRYDGSIPANAKVEFDCKTLNLVINTGIVVFNPGQDYILTKSFKVIRRGLHKISKTKVTVMDWLLISGKIFNFQDEQEILVLPHIYPFSTAPESLGAGILGIVASTKRGRSSEIWGIRDYQPGDDYKIISWKSMAKSPDHKPMTKIMAGEVGSAITVILDIGKDMGMQNGEDISLDLGADVAASLCYNYIRRGTDTGLILFDNKLRTIVKPDRGDAQIDSILRYLAQVQPSLDKFIVSNFTKIVQQLPPDYGKKFVLIIGRTDDLLLDTFIPKIALNKNLIVVVVHTELNKVRAEQIQSAAKSAGVPVILTTAGTVRETIDGLERWSYAVVART